MTERSEESTGGHGRRGYGLVLLIPVVVAVMLTMFAWPASETRPRDLPIGLVAPDPIVGPISDRLATGGADGSANGDEAAFDVHPYPSADAAREAIEGREVYGALVLDADGVTVLTASAAGPVVAGLLDQVGQGMAEQLPAMGEELSQRLPAPMLEALAGQLPIGPGADVPTEATVVDVVPTTASDPRGAVLATSVLPMVMAGMALGAGAALLFRPGLAQALVLLGTAALAGLVAIGIAQVWLDALDGNPWVNAGVMATAIAAIAGGVAGLGALLGRAGIGLGAATMMLLGNPLSGIASAPEMLPTWAGTLGQWLPPGAGGSLLRSVAFFDGAAAGGPLLVLSVWAGGGLLLVLLVGLVRRLRSGRSAQAEVGSRDEVPLSREVSAETS